jgi:hypothetical protein
MGEIEVGGPTIEFATVCGELVLCTQEDGRRVRAVSLSQRRVAWARDLVGEVDSRSGVQWPNRAIAFVAGSVADAFIVTRGQSTLRCASEDGSVLWQVAVCVPYYWPLVGRGLIPVLSNDRFVVIDELSGRVRVDRKHPELVSMHYVRPGSLWGEDAVAFVSETGHVALLSLVNGDLLSWGQYDVAFVATAVADGRLFVSGADGNLWIFEEGGATTTSVVVPDVAASTSARGRRKAPSRTKRSRSKKVN